MPNKTTTKAKPRNNGATPRRRRNRARMANKPPVTQASDRRANGPKGDIQGVRTQASIVQSLASQMKNVMIGGSKPLYVRCRTDPFHGAGRTSIPDGGNNNFISVDTFSVDTITCSQAKTSFIIQTLPCLPALAMIAGMPSTNLNINGTDVTAPSVIQPDSQASQAAWTPLSVPTPYTGTLNGYGLGAPQSDPYASTKARMVAVGYRLIYTGPTQTCSGAIVVTPNDVSFNIASTTTTGATPSVGQTFNLRGVNATQVASYTAGLGTVILDADLKISPSTMTRESVSFRPEQGVLILPRHRTSNYKLVPTQPVPYGLTVGFNTSAALPEEWYSVLNTANPNYRGGIVWYDDDWESFQVYATGLNSDASFRWETVLCMEYNPQLSSPMAPLATKRSPNQPAEIKQAEQELSRLPAATPLAGRPNPR